VFLIPQVTINYDNSKYLPKDIQTLRALEVMDEEFGLNGYVEIMVTDISVEQALGLYLELSAIDNIKYIEFNPSTEVSYKDNSALYKVTFSSDNYDDNTKESIISIRNSLSDYQYYMKGESVTALEYNNILKDEIIIIIIILIPIVLLVLFLTTTSWIEPLIFIIVVLVSVVINMGTNILFSSISYMTHATSGVLQLAICMDYSVILLHSYRKYNKTCDKSIAIKKAVKSSFIPILGSALTTFFGFVALMTMRYKIGFDIGSVLAKGTIISVISAFLLMPGLIYIFDSLLKKTEHKSLFKENKYIHNFLYKSRFVIPFIALLIIAGAFFTQKTNKFVYSETSFVSDSEVISLSKDKIDTTFGNNNIFTILIPSNELAKEGVLLYEIQSLVMEEDIELKSLSSVTIFHTKLNEESFSSFFSNFGLDQASTNQIMQLYGLMKSQSEDDEFSVIDLINFVEQTTLLTNEQKQMFLLLSKEINQGIEELSTENYNRIILTVDIESESEKTFDFVGKLNELVSKEFDDRYYMVGESVAIYDIKEVVRKDFDRTNLLIIILVFIVILLSFKSSSIPVILILLIEGAIWVNMAVPALMNSNLLFIGYIIVSCIMLGATIDYANYTLLTILCL